MLLENTIDYLLEFLLGKDLVKECLYGKRPASARLTIIQSGWFECPVEAELKGEIDGLPVCFGEPRVERIDGKIVLYADVVAMAFYFLSRYEELLNPDRDIHGRFSAKSSFLGKHNLLENPILDSWSLWLRQQLGGTMPNCGKLSKLYLTHDVDQPWDTTRFKNFLSRIKNSGWKNPLRCLLWGWDYLTKRDTVDVFDWLLGFDGSLVKDVGKEKCESIFFFLAPETGDGPDSFYLKDSRFRSLFTRVHTEASWGLHASYFAGREMKFIRKEVEVLKEATGVTKVVYNRHHYLRMIKPMDLQFLEDAGFTDDFSLAFADYAGFRTGTCRPYRWINPITRQVGRLVVHPLTIMECSVTGCNYMGFNQQRAYSYGKKLIKTVAAFGGECTLLWHNTSLTRISGDWHRQWYCDMVTEAMKYI